MNKVDVGFRVLKIDSSNMEDAYYSTPENQEDIKADYVKEDRTPEDLLFQVMGDLGIEPSMPIETFEIHDAEVFRVFDDTPCKECGCEGGKSKLIACLDSEPFVNKWVLLEIARMQPDAIVIRDSAFKDDLTKTQMLEIFGLFSPSTTISSI